MALNKLLMDVYINPSEDPNIKDDFIKKIEPYTEDTGSFYKIPSIPGMRIGIWDSNETNLPPITDKNGNKYCEINLHYLENTKKRDLKEITEIIENCGFTKQN